jgi:histidinol-phosphate/aromatic aminotransferase/cobyric acid decarboxylase-like protein
MINLKAIKTVYSYYLPEVREIIDGLTVEYPHDVYLKSTQPGGLDSIEKPVIDRFREFQKDALVGLEKFPYQYWTAGSEEGIREYMTWIAAKDRSQTILTLKDEYEGYDAVAQSRGLYIDRFRDHHKYENPVLFLSNPSARDGNIIPNNEVHGMCDKSPKVFYDLSYLGSTQKYQFDLTHKNIDAVAVSFSKPYGLFYQRIGMLFCKHEIPSLYGNRWFKNVLSIMIADRVMEEIGSAMTVPQRYKRIQEQIVNAINERHGLGLAPSDAFLLAHRPRGGAHDAALTEEQRESLEPFARGDFYRLCLTKYFEEFERYGTIR